MGVSGTLRRSARPALGAALALPFAGCKGVLDPQGPVGAAEKLILLNSLGIMLAIVIPTILATLGAAWWFRASNARARYRPDWDYSGRIELVVWAIPAMVVLLLGGIGWVGSHDLDPPRPLAARQAPLQVEVIALDWKWLFIYPVQGVASVNRLVAPAGRPVSFRLTSASVMNSFFVPQLGSQIYAMPGMAPRLNLQADRPGRYDGLSAMFSGDGFSRMSFTYEAVPPDQFDAWLAAAKAKGSALDAAAYAALAKPSRGVAPVTYGAVAPGLFDAVTRTQAPPAPGSPAHGPAMSGMEH